MTTTSKMGRGPFTARPLKVNKSFTPNARHIAWMQFINLHGPLSSLYLHEFDKHEKCSYDAVKDAIKKCFDGGMIYRPVQQLETANADYHHYIYDLTPRGEKYLKDNGLWTDALRPSGQFPHQFMTACITASIHIMCNREGYTYIPAHEILKDQSLGVEIPFSWNGKKQSNKLIPDSVFAIDYGGSYLAFVVEADRNTEPNIATTPHRKSAKRSLLQYVDFVKKPYGLNCPVIVLNVTVSDKKVEHLLELVEAEIGNCRYQTFGVVSEFATPWKPPALLTHLFDKGLKRHGKEDFVIKK